jgi:hypothetical protein
VPLNPNGFYARAGRAWVNHKSLKKKLGRLEKVRRSVWQHSNDAPAVCHVLDHICFGGDSIQTPFRPPCDQKVSQTSMAAAESRLGRLREHAETGIKEL